MNVSPLSTAKTIDIESIFGNNINWPIANYGMTTTSTATNGKKPLPSGWIDLFLSSSNNALYTAPELFTLRHITTNGSVSFRDTSHNSIRFNAVLSSARGYLASDANKTKGVSITYDGTDYYGNPNTQSKYLEIGPVHQTNQGGTVFTRWYDSGTISVNIPSGQIINGEEVTVQGLVSGQYTSNIFLHIVSNL